MDDITALKKRILDSHTPEDLKEKLLKDTKRLEKAVSLSSIDQVSLYENTIKYIETILAIPFGKYTEDALSLEEAKVMMDQNHYGLDVVKESILEYLAIMQLKKENGDDVTETDISNAMKNFSGNSSRPPVLCLVGVQGIGKTTFGKSIAHALKRNFVRISLNALGNTAQLKGSPRTVIGAEPGQIIKGLIRSNSMNPVILCDEVDKMAGSEEKRFDFLASVMEFVDPEQNATFIDQYVDYPVDLSKVFFIFTANTLSTISAALLDRMEIIRFSSYSDDEKLHIAKDYLMPKIRKSTGLLEKDFIISEDAWPLIIRPFGFDAGIRSLERNLMKIARKIAKLKVEKKVDQVNITPANFRQFIPEDIGVYS